jgi:hypothetical protein
LVKKVPIAKIPKSEGDNTLAKIIKCASCITANNINSRVVHDAP